MSSKRYKKLPDTNELKAETFEKIILDVKKNCTTKFDESIDVSIMLNLKNKKEELTFRTVANLPNGNGKKIKVGVLCEESKINEAKASGADIYGSEDFTNKIISGQINFNKLIATPAMMSKMGKLGKILGPKGLMPNPKLGTVTNDIKSAVKALKSGQVEIKSDPDGNLGVSIGRKSFPDSKIQENYKSLMDTVVKEKPSVIKSDFILSSYVTSTMGTSYKLKLNR